MPADNTFKQRSQSFDLIAVDYDTFRPGYPPEMVDFIVTKSGIPHHGSILEVGSGTGKATFPFAQRDYSILCIEPGKSMAEVAQKKLSKFPKVQFQISSFEAWNAPRGDFDLMISGQAFHWVDPQVGYFKVHSVLKQGGWMALFWNMDDDRKNPVDDEVRRVYREYAPTLAENRPGTEESISKREAEIKACGFFEDIILERFPWSARYSTAEYLGQKSTMSDHIILPGEERNRLMKALAEVIDDHGGFIERYKFAMLYMGRKAPDLS